MLELPEPMAGVSDGEAFAGVSENREGLGFKGLGFQGFRVLGF